MGETLKNNPNSTIESFERNSARCWRQRQLSREYTLDGTTPFQFSEDVVGFLNGKCQSVILDMGCGSGRMLDFLQKIGEKVIAFDISNGAIQEVRKAHSNLCAFVATAPSIPLMSSSVEFIFCWRVLHSLSNRQRQRTLSEVQRVLTPGGKAVLSMASRADWRIQKYVETNIAQQIEPGVYVLDEDGIPAIQRFYSKAEVLEELQPWVNVHKLKHISEPSGWPHRKPNFYWMALITKKPYLNGTDGDTTRTASRSL